jgi:hypothetical protein
MQLIWENIALVEEDDTVLTIMDFIVGMTELYEDEVRPDDWVIDPTKRNTLIIFNSDFAMLRLDATIGKPKPPRKEKKPSEDVPFFALDDGGDWEFIRQKLLAAGYDPEEAQTIVARLMVAAAQELANHDTSQSVQQSAVRDSESPA